MMQLRNMKLTTVCLLLTCILQAFSAEIGTTEAPMSCYVCQNCEEKEQYAEKLQTCNEEFFATTTVSSPDITEATTNPITTLPTEADITTNPPTPTTIADISSSSAESTEASPPTPPTAGPTETVPTPSNPGTVAGPNDEESNLPQNIAASNQTSAVAPTGSTPSSHNFVPIDSSESTLVLDSSAGGRASRQLREAANSDFTFHCYRAVIKVNDKLVTNRGCSRVATREAVCTQVQQMNNNNITKTKVKKCYACSESLCNGSTALAVSTATLLFAVLAALLHRN